MEDTEKKVLLDEKETLTELEKMKTLIFLSFDLGMRGDYEGLYYFLDKHKAQDRGYNLAVLPSYKIPDNITSKELLSIIKKDISENVKIKKADRIYVVCKVAGTSKIVAGFLFGRQKQAPWDGYYQPNNDAIDFEV